MKIAVSSTGKDLNSQIDPRFGRCQYFIFLDPETMEFEAFENTGLMASGGAGVQAAQLVAQKGASASSRVILDLMRRQPFQHRGSKSI